MKTKLRLYNYVADFMYSLLWFFLYVSLIMYLILCNMYSVVLFMLTSIYYSLKNTNPRVINNTGWFYVEKDYSAYVKYAAKRMVHIQARSSALLSAAVSMLRLYTPLEWEYDRRLLLLQARCIL